jgi:hypothetical protein
MWSERDAPSIVGFSPGRSSPERFEARPISPEKIRLTSVVPFLPVPGTVAEHHLVSGAAQAPSIRPLPE